jgi:hypothetical protein
MFITLTRINSPTSVAPFVVNTDAIVFITPHNLGKGFETASTLTLRTGHAIDVAESAGSIMDEANGLLPAPQEPGNEPDPNAPPVTTPGTPGTLATASTKEADARDSTNTEGTKSESKSDEPAKAAAKSASQPIINPRGLRNTADAAKGNAVASKPADAPQG